MFDLTLKVGNKIYNGLIILYGCTCNFQFVGAVSTPDKTIIYHILSLIRLYDPYDKSNVQT